VAGQKFVYCEANELPPSDDDSTGPVEIPFPLRYFGNVYTQLYVNNNGNVTFGGPLGPFTPDALDGGESRPIIAPFLADIDTRDTDESDVVTYGASEDGRQFCVNWVDVESYSGDSSSGKLNSFQLLLTTREGAPTSGCVRARLSRGRRSRRTP
jgi:hypothetical protein